MTGKNDIVTPDGYFQDLKQRLGTIPSRESSPTTFQKLSPYFAYAAALALMVAAGNLVFNSRSDWDSPEEWYRLSYLAQSLDPDGVLEDWDDEESTTNQNTYYYEKDY